MDEILNHNRMKVFCDCIDELLNHDPKNEIHPWLIEIEPQPYLNLKTIHP